MTNKSSQILGKLFVLAVAMTLLAEGAHAQFAAPPIADEAPRTAYNMPMAPPVQQSAMPQAGRNPQLIEECERIARIDGQVVLACDLLWEANLLMSDKLDQIPPDKVEEIRDQLMVRLATGRDLIDRKLVYADFIRNVPSEAIPRIEKQLTEQFESEEISKWMKNLKCTSREELEFKLHEWGSSLEVVKKNFMERAVVGSWLHERIKVNEEVTHVDLLDYYHEHVADYSFPTQVRWEELHIRTGRYPSPEAAFAAIAQLGNDVLRQYPVPQQVAGPIFTEIAKASSQGFTAPEGGGHDWTTQGSLKAQAIDQAIFSLPLGQLSQVLKSDSGFHIVRVTERREAGREPFAEVQSKIKEDLRKARFREEVEKYLGKLRKDAQIWTKYTGFTSAEALMPKPNENERL